MADCPCYPDCEILPDGRCLGQACIELVLKEKEKVVEPKNGNIQGKTVNAWEVHTTRKT